MNRPTHGGSKKQGIPSSTNLNTTAHVAFRNRNVVCPCNRHVVFCMNQLGGVGAGGVPGNSYMFAPGADGVNKNKILCGVNHKNILNPSQFELIYKTKIDLLKFLSNFNSIINSNNSYNVGVIEFGNNIHIVTNLTNKLVDNNNFSLNFDLINGSGKINNPNDLIGNEYIILGYYQLVINNTNPSSKTYSTSTYKYNRTLTTLHFKLKSYNDDLFYYNIEWLGKKPQSIFKINGNNSYDNNYFIKELYMKK